MLDFIQQLMNPSMSFLLYAFLTGAVASVAFGIIGTYVVTRRITALPAPSRTASWAVSGLLYILN